MPEEIKRRRLRLMSSSNIFIGASRSPPPLPPHQRTIFTSTIKFKDDLCLGLLVLKSHSKNEIKGEKWITMVKTKTSKTTL
jgi:hypothetical protein